MRMTTALYDTCYIWPCVRIRDLSNRVIARSLLGTDQNVVVIWNRSFKRPPALGGLLVTKGSSERNTAMNSAACMQPSTHHSLEPRLPVENVRTVDRSFRQGMARPHVSRSCTFKLNLRAFFSSHQGSPGAFACEQTSMPSSILMY